MMLDLNDYYPSSNLPRLYRERKQKGDEEEAQSTAQLAMIACRRSIDRNPADPWALPTLMAAAFDAGDIDSATDLLDKSRAAAIAPFQVASAIPDMRRGMSLLADPAKAEELAPILGNFQRLLHPTGTVTALAGRRIDAAGASDPRFPPQNESIVKQRIKNMLIGTASTSIVSSAACGADILALECAQELGLSRRVVLPFSRDRFRETSVADRGDEWRSRFDAILSQLGKGDTVELNGAGSDDEAYAIANARILDEASNIADPQGQPAIASIVWNGISRGPADLTEAFRKLAIEREMEVVSVRTI